MNITTRREWHARPPKRFETVAPSARRLFVVHYTFGPDTQTVRSVQDHCMDARGFSDIDYNFLVRGTTGEIYEGRGWNVVGSHTVGHNTDGLGVCVMTRGPISAAAKASVRALYREGSRRAGRDLAVRGHRDLSPTECPGDEIARWLRAGGVTEDSDARTLRLTSPYLHGDDVREVQHRVGVRVDGVYGPNTAHAVERWQATHQLVADGVVGPKTRARMGLRA